MSPRCERLGCQSDPVPLDDERKSRGDDKEQHRAGISIQGSRGVSFERCLRRAGEPAVSLRGYGAFERTSHPVNLTDSSPPDEIVNEYQCDDCERYGVDDFTRPGACRREVALEEGRGYPHQEAHRHGDGQTPKPRRDYRRERCGDEKSEVSGIEPDDGSS